MTDGSLPLAGRAVLVTGASTGIGQAIVVAAAAAGARVVGVSRSEMAETADLVAAAGGTFVGVGADLSDRRAIRPMLDGVWEAHGPLDGLVNNAGIIRRADAVEVTDEDWDAVLNVNLTALFVLSQAYARQVVAAGRRGRIVNIASLLSHQGGVRVAAYAAAKHGVAGVTRALCNEWAARGINVNAVAPGYIETNNTAPLRADPERSAAILARIPAGRWGRPGDIAGAVLFLLSEASDYVHGAILPVDGGWLAR